MRVAQCSQYRVNQCLRVLDARGAPGEKANLPQKRTYPAPRYLVLEDNRSTAILAGRHWSKLRDFGQMARYDALEAIERDVCDEHYLQLASAPNVMSLVEAASLAAGDRLGEVQGPYGA